MELIDLIMSAQINQHDHFLFCLGLRVRFKRKNDTAIILYPTGPQAFQSAAEFVCFQTVVEGVFGKCCQNLENFVPKCRIIIRIPLECSLETFVPG